MSFITKRERVFNEYDLLDLPSRNEGKLKAYASCTDSRAWSHFNSDKTEHLVEIIKRNNEMCRPKYVPTQVIVETLMVAKNAEIGRLKRKIEEFQEMIAAYDSLELTCDQKCEIAKAHSAIKAANKDLDDLCLDLDLSGFTEGVDSEAFETGKSRGDQEWPASASASVQKMDTKSNQTGLECPCDASTSAYDNRIDDMQGEIISKDAKLNAMKNTIAVMENDVCEPYCIYAHIYTALEKIFGILCQNEKYKQYLDLLMAGKDTRCIDIKGKILYKLKVFEKFSLALIAPCSQGYEPPNNKPDCSCYNAEVVARVETTFALTSAESKTLNLDHKRAQLVANIIDSEEMKEILSKENSINKFNVEYTNDNFFLEDYNINTENLKRLKSLQEDYDDLITCYENLKHDQELLKIKCQKFEEDEKDVESLKTQLRSYDQVWKEKDYYKRRSVDLDSLKEKFFVLSEETSDLESKLKAEAEINDMKTNTIKELHTENIELEKKLNDALIAYEKEKNSLQCKLKEADCKIMCYEEQIKSLASQIDRLLEHDNGKVFNNDSTLEQMNTIAEIENMRDQIKNLKDALLFSNEEKINLQQDFDGKLVEINHLRLHVEDCESQYQNALQRIKYLEDYLENVIDENKIAVENLTGIIVEKSQELNNHLDVINQKASENSVLLNQLDNVNQLNKNITTELKQEKNENHLTKQESDTLLKKVKSYDKIIQKQSDEFQTLQEKCNELEKLKTLYLETESFNDKLKHQNDDLVKKIQKLYEINGFESDQLKLLEHDDNQFENLLKLTKSQSLIMENKAKQFDEMTMELNSLQGSYMKILSEKKELEKEIKLKSLELNNALDSVKLSKKESVELLNVVEHIESDYNKLNEDYQNMLRKENNFEAISENLNQELLGKDKKIEELSDLIKALQNDQLIANDTIKNLKNQNLTKQKSLNDIKKESEELNNKIDIYKSLEQELDKTKTNYDQLQNENEELRSSLKAKIDELNLLTKENGDLNRHAENLQAYSEDLEKKITDTRQNTLDKNCDLALSFESVKDELENLEREKKSNQSKIRDLHDKLDDSENTITSLGEELLTRDARVVVLENHINELENEIMQLQASLKNMIDTGEGIRENSLKQLKSNLTNMGAHHSKATHNMKLELAKLQNEKTNIENELSRTKNSSEESLKEKDKYFTELKDLKNEREIIVTSIKQLEIASVGGSELTPTNCYTENILDSLLRIQKYISENNAKTSSLEKTLIRVQTSSQLLLTKTDEAKAIIDKEKQKIIFEKEAAVRDKQYMEEKLQNIKDELTNQISNDKQTINDLEREILNQKLIIDKINSSRQSYIDKLKEDLSSLQNLYKSSISKVNELEEQIKNINDDRSTNLDLINILNKKLEQKSNQISDLQGELENIKNKSLASISIQTSSLPKHNIYSQTDPNIDEKQVDEKYETLSENVDILKINKPYNEIFNKKSHELLPRQNQHSVNEVRILTASIEQSFDFLKGIEQGKGTTSSIENKLHNLQLCKLDNYSISCFDENSISNEDEFLLSTDQLPKEAQKLFANVEYDNFVDIYEKPSIPIIPTKTNKIPPLNNNTNLLKAQPANNIEINNLFEVSNEPSITNLSSKTNKTLPLNSSFDDSKLYTTHSIGNSNLINNYERQSIPNLFSKTNDLNNVPSNFDDLKPSTSHKTINVSFDTETKPKSNNDILVIFGEPSQSVVSKDEKLKDHNSVPIETRKTQINSKSKSNRIQKRKDSAEKNNNRTKITVDMPRIEAASFEKLEKYEISLKTSESNGITLSQSILSNSVNLYDDRYYDSLDIESNEENLKQDLVQQYSSKADDNFKNMQESPSFYKNDPLKIQTLSQKKVIDKNKLTAESEHRLSRVDGDVLLVKTHNQLQKSQKKRSENFGLDYILNSVNPKVDPFAINAYKASKAINSSKSEDQLSYKSQHSGSINLSPVYGSSTNYTSISGFNSSKYTEQIIRKYFTEQGIIVKERKINDLESKIQKLTKALANTEEEFKRKLEVVKIQYDNNVKSIINKHNQGVESIQNLHEETLQDILKIHENEVENLRSISLEAMRRVDRLEKENMKLKIKVDSPLDEEPVKIPSSEMRKRASRSRDASELSKTRIEAFNVKPKSRSHGPCTCSLDVKVSDTIRNMFDQVDAEQRKMAEHAYLKYIANKIISGSVEQLDSQELGFLHLKVCKTWKSKVNKEEALQKRIDTLESELMNKQRYAQQHMEDLDRQVAEERQRLQEAREAVYRSVPGDSGVTDFVNGAVEREKSPPDADLPGCNCNSDKSEWTLNERKSAGDLRTSGMTRPMRKKRGESNRAVLAKLDTLEKRERKVFLDDPPTRLRKTNERAAMRSRK